MRVAQIIDTLQWGGAQRMQMFLVETLVPLGIDITVIDLGGSPNPVVPAALTAMGASVISFPFDQLLSPGSLLHLIEFLRAEKFDLIHTYLTYANIVGSLAGALCGTPVITSIRNADFAYKGYNWKRKMLERIAIGLFSRRTMANGVVVGQFARQYLGNNPIIDVIPNAIGQLSALSEDERQTLRSELLGDPQRTMILSVGRLTPAKGFFDLFEAFAQVHPSYPNCTLVIAGGGDLQEDLQSRIHDLGLEQDILLLGSRDDARQLMGAADIYVNSSHWEGTPVSVLEAMATGLPVIATRVGENPYLLAESAGLLVAPHQPCELAEAFKVLLASSAEREKFARAGLERVTRYYSREAWRDSLLRLYAKEVHLSNGNSPVLWPG